MHSESWKSSHRRTPSKSAPRRNDRFSSEAAKRKPGHPPGPNPGNEQLLRMMAMAEAMGLSASALGSGLPRRISPNRIYCEKKAHRRLYDGFLDEAKRVVKVANKCRITQSRQARAYDAMSRVASCVARELVSVSQAARLEGISLTSIYRYIGDYPIVWKNILSELGLGWRGDSEGAPRSLRKAAPRHLVSRVRMQRAAGLFTHGLSLIFICRQQGARVGGINVLIATFPEYWAFLCQRKSQELGLKNGEQIVAHIEDRNRNIIVRRRRGLGKTARRKIRRDAGIEPRYKAPRPSKARQGDTVVLRSETPVTMRQFIVRFCEPLSAQMLKRALEQIRYCARWKKIILPKKVEKPGGSQAHEYRAGDLLKAWPGYKNVRPDLPDLLSPTNVQA